MPAAVYVGDGEIDGARARRSRARRRATCWSRCRTAASAAPTCTSCSSVRPSRAACSVTSGRARSPRSAPTSTGWEIGARVVQNPTPGCGECRACRRGRPSVCLRREPPDLLDFSRGAFCRYKVVPASRLLRVPDALSTRAAALTEPTAIAIHTVNLSGVHARRPRARDRRRAGRPAHHRGAARPRHRRHHRVGAGAAAPRARARGRRDARDRARRRCRARRWAVPSTRRSRSRSSARATRAAAESAFDQLDYAGTLVFVGTGHEMPRVNHNRVIVLELTIIARVQLRHRGLRARARAARVGRAPARPAHRARRRAARRRARHHAPPRRGRAARQGHGAARRSTRMSDAASAAAQPRRDQHGPGGARRPRPRRGPRLLRRRVRLDRRRQHRRGRQPADPVHRARSASSSTCCPATRPSARPPLDHFGLQVDDARRARRDRRAGQGAGGRTTSGCTVIDVHARTTHGPTARLHAHERLHRLRAAAHDRAPTPPTSRAPNRHWALRCSQEPGSRAPDAPANR